VPDHYDVIIIGTGAGGGTLAHRLAPSGKRILLLERGGYLPREPDNWDSEQVFRHNRYVTHEEWIDKHGVAFRPHAQYFVGGNTKVYGAILFRLRERDFGEVRHYGGVSPAWPLSYADFEPYYAEAAPGRSRTRPSRTSPASRSCTTTSPAPGTSPSTCPSASTWTRATPRRAAACAAIASTDSRA
jgi:choline dehydrogenase-like flavoprotein